MAPRARSRGRVQVVVLGDFGRSPRMQYHALSLAKQARLDVDVVAYAGSTPRSEILREPRIHLHLISPPPAWLARYLPRVLALATRVLLQLFQLAALTLARLPRPDYVLLQTPPCAPAFTACRLVALLRGAAFVVDWHNFAYTLMALKFGAGGDAHPLVRLARWYESTACRGADAHLCVTDAMRDWLAREWRAAGARDGGPTAGVLQTRRRERRPRTPHAHRPGARRRRRARVGANARAARAIAVHRRRREREPRERRRRREKRRAPARPRLLPPSSGRPALVVSSTSWTPDEDFGVLLDALVEYDRVAREDAMEAAASRGSSAGGGDGIRGRASSRRSYPDLFVVVTGKGPERESYEARIAALTLERVVVRTAWLASEDYPTLLGAADLGVCLHTSSSGLDLPMKVVDMQGAGLPVAAVRYDVIGELVRTVEDEEREARGVGRGGERGEGRGRGGRGGGGGGFGGGGFGQGERRALLGLGGARGDAPRAHARVVDAEGGAGGDGAGTSRAGGGGGGGGAVGRAVGANRGARVRRGVTRRGCRDAECAGAAVPTLDRYGRNTLKIP